MGIVRSSDNKGKQHLLFVGAHPDDADIECGGTAIKLLQAGHTVTYVSMTNGNAGHHAMKKEDLASRRLNETKAVTKLLGVNYIIVDNNDAELQATLENRHKLIKIIRKVKPTIIVTHRPNDYHADHRNTSLLIQDAMYLVAVPLVCPDIAALTYNPVVVYHQDGFTKPYPFSPNVFVDITDVIDKKMEVLSLYESQVFEWLPWIEGYLHEVPKEKDKRIDWLKSKWGNRGDVNTLKSILQKLVSPAIYKKVKHIEAFEASEYGARLTKNNAPIIFPFGIVNF
ncbi:MAG: LmbE family protein [Candidatus Gottesmanbacteria bacterium GW2011_GWA1_48_13]|uniref:LmbE family protein n=2 Tax=Candidatus Gottesmaniibacteriota TaxID=1752720 RepID=A0A0G1UNR6_9BACT|nr:MAG: LmbE family protein [Candidatus Gottesmanbacteria bacterium GW2011_GWA1_48_13]